MKFCVPSLMLGLLSVVFLGACNRQDKVPSVTVYQQENFPSDLSQWGVIYRDGDDLVLNDDVIAYDLNSPLFTDYAHKLRTMWIPPGKKIVFEPGPDLQLPVGSIVSKTFYYPRQGKTLLNTDSQVNDFSSRGLNLNNVQLIETRIMVHLADGWHGLPYIWDDAQRRATLAITGDVKALTLLTGDVSQSFNYVVPDANQCQACHIDNMITEQMHLLGVKVRHLDKSYRGAYNSDNQLAYLLARNKITALPKVINKNVNWQDSAQSIEQRARSYLDINCGHCHNPAGPADTSGMFLNKDEEQLIRLGVCKPPVAAGQGTGGRKVGISPGHADQSILSYRMGSLDLGAMMPELGRSLIHTEGVSLVNEWINAMPGDCD